ncbi:MAG: ABC transporter permease [Planctomycetaceae bacterium]|nr:ABC transporter permease [Planctomycetaceae bacterium]
MKQNVHLGKWLRSGGTFLALIIMCAIFSTQSATFFTSKNTINILQASSINALVALGMTVVIILGSIDLSVGSIAAFSAVFMADMMVNFELPWVLCLAMALALGVVLGAVNAFLIAVVKLQPFIVTLGTTSLYRAIALLYTDGNPIFNLPSGFRTVITSYLWGLPAPVYFVLAMTIITWIILNRMPLGEYVVATGGNEEAATISGVPVVRTKFFAYCFAGFLAALAAAILVGRLGAAEPIVGMNWETTAIASAAIGGASLAGGRGSAIGTILGAVILGTLINGLTLMNVQAFWQLAATGAIILIAMIVDKVARGKE